MKIKIPKPKIRKPVAKKPNIAFKSNLFFRGNMLEIIKTTLKGMVILLMVTITLSIPVAILTYIMHVSDGLYAALLLMFCGVLFMCYQIGTEFQEKEESRSMRPPK